MVRPRVLHARVCKAFALVIFLQSQQALTIHRPDLSHTPKQRLENNAGTFERGFPHQGTIRTQVFNDGKTSLVESSLSPVNKHLSYGRSVAQQTKFAHHTLKAAVVMDSSGEIESPPESAFKDQWVSNDLMPEQVSTNEIAPAPSLTEARLAASVKRHAPTAVILGSSGEAVEAAMVTPASANSKLELDRLMASGAKIASFVTPIAAIGGPDATTALSATGAHAVPAILSVPAASAVPAAPVAPVSPATVAAPASAAVPVAAAVPAVVAVPAVAAAPAAATTVATPATAATAAAPAAPAAPATPAAPAAPASSVAPPIASAAVAPPGTPASATDAKSQARSLLPVALVFLLVFLVALALIALIEIKRRRQLERSSNQAASGQLGGNLRHNSYRPSRTSASTEGESHHAFKKSSYRARLSADSQPNASSGADKESPRSLMDRGGGVPGQSVPLGAWEKPKRKSKSGRPNSLLAPAATSSTRLSNAGSASASPSLYRDRAKKGTNSTTLHHDPQTAGLSSEHLQNLRVSSEQLSSAPETCPEEPRPLKLTTTVERDEEGDYLI